MLASKSFFASKKVLVVASNEQLLITASRDFEYHTFKDNSVPRSLDDLKRLDKLKLAANDVWAKFQEFNAAALGDGRFLRNTRS